MVDKISENSILSLDDAATTSASLVGMKAQQLGKLRSLGFNVPDGFVITTALSSQLGTLAISEWSDEVKRAIIQSWQHLTPRNEQVAIRSSGSVEDTFALSYAGQYETLLNISNEHDLLSGILRVITSTDLSHIRAYQNYHRLVSGEVRMAVVIQKMVYGDISGVVFTQNIPHKKNDELVVEAVAGLGHTLVSGEKQAARAILKRSDLTLVEIANTKRNFIKSDVATNIANTAMNVEKQLGQPMDIEFTYHSGSTIVLQARPITASTITQQTWQNEIDTHTSYSDIWTCHNVQEVFPEVNSPLTITLWHWFMKPVLNLHHTKLGIKRNKEQFQLFGHFYHKVHANVSVVRKLCDRILFQDPNTVVEAYLGKQLPYPDREAWYKRWFFRIKSFPFLAFQVFRMEHIIKDLEEEIIEFERHLRKTDLTKLSDKQLDDLYQEIATDYAAKTVGYHVTTFILPTLGIHLLRRLLRPISKNNLHQHINLLLSGLACVESEMISERIWNLSRIAKKEYIKITQEFDPYDEKLPGDWREAFLDFIHHHGHRGLYELGVETKVWRQDPKNLLQMVRKQVDLSDDHSPHTHLEMAVKERLQMTDKISRQLWLPRRLLFKVILNRAQKWTALRELTKSVEARGIRLLDFLHDEIGRRFVEMKILNHPNELSYLRYREMHNVLLARVDEDYQQRIISRQKAMNTNRHVKLPEYFNGIPTPITEDFSHLGAMMLKGVSVNHGNITAPARVIKDLSHADKLLPGDVLVTHISDAAWTPLFTLASAVVIDIGSIMSHGSIIAREFGLPTVINVKTGTTDIKDGDIVNVDGENGIVTIIKRNT